MRVLTFRGNNDSKVNQDSSVKRQSNVFKIFAKQDENRIFRERTEPCGVAQALGALGGRLPTWPTGFSLTTLSHPYYKFMYLHKVSCMIIPPWITHCAAYMRVLYFHPSSPLE